MNNGQKKIIRILNEIDRLCSDNDIDYFAGPNLIAQSFKNNGHFSEMKMTATILMPSDCIMDFISAFDSKGYAEYELESMLTYDSYIGFTLRMVDRNSTYIRLRDGDNHIFHGIFVEINPIRNYDNGLSAKFTNFLERGWENNGFNQVGNKTILNRSAVSVIKGLGVIGSSRRAEFVFHRLVKDNSNVGKAKKIGIRIPRKSTRVLNNKFFDKASHIEFEGNLYRAPRDPEKFLDDYYGPIWRDEDFKFGSAYDVMLSNVPYREYLKQCDESGLDLEKLASDRKTVRKMPEHVKYDIKGKERAVLIAKRSGDRLAVYQHLLPHIEEIKLLYKKNDLVRLRFLFAENEERTIYYLNNDLGFCASKLCMDIQVDIFRATNRDNLADKLIELVPKEHYTPIATGEVKQKNEIQ